MLAKKLIASRAGLSAGGIQFIGYVYDERTRSGSSMTISLSGWSGGIGGSLQENDLIVVIQGSGATSNEGSNWTSGATTGGGIGPLNTEATLPWTAVISETYTTDTYDTNLGCSYFKCGASPPSSINLLTGETSGRSLMTIILAFRGVHTTTPMDTTAVSATGTNGSQADAPSITPVTAGAHIWAVGYASRASASANDKVAPSNMTTVKSDFYDSTTDCGYLIVSKKEDWTSGAFDPAAWTGTTNAADSWSAFTFALRPA